MKRVLITGAAGFIGSHLTRHYLHKGWEVVGVDDLSTGSKDNLPEHENFKFLEYDISWYLFADEVLHPTYNLILNFACPASPKEYKKHPVDTLQTCSVGTYRLINLAQDNNCPILMASTSEVYGDPLEHPQSESYWGNVNPIGERSCYDVGKRYMEALTMAYHDLGVDTRIIRIFNTFGERMAKDDGRVVSNFINQALQGEPITVYGDGSQTRSLCYIDDLINGIDKVLDEGDHMPYNLGNDYEITILELAMLIRELCQSESEIVFMGLPKDDPVRRKPDLTRAKGLGYWPMTSLEQGLINTIEYYRR